MPVGLSSPAQLLPINGVRIATARAGIKPASSKDDLVLFELAEKTTLAAVFTRNRFCAAPVILARNHLDSSPTIRYLLINSGNANAGTGKQGINNAKLTCQAVAELEQVQIQTVLPFSTGVIGEQLPVEKIIETIPTLFENLQLDNWLAAAKGIMTTDTVPKGISRQLDIDGQSVTITGISKGSGMIRPDMATMLSYIATDALIDQEELQRCLHQVVEQTFNAITVDGDTSTNDACVLMATATSGCRVDVSNKVFMQGLNDVFQYLAQAIIRDGEGATKFIEIQVQGASSHEDAREMAFTIAHSPLVKTALFASDANWGRILAAIGRARISSLEIDRVDLFLGDTCLIEKGLPHPHYNEDKGHAEVLKDEILIHVNLNLGSDSATVWTSDLTYDYVKINAEYRS